MTKIGKKISTNVDFYVCKRDILIRSTKHAKRINNERSEGGSSTKSVVYKVNYTHVINLRKCGGD